MKHKEMNMTLRLLVLLCCVTFPLMASAQASGGQIRRKARKVKTETRKLTEPRVTTKQSQQFSLKNSFTPPTPVTISSLMKYNVVVGTFNQLESAQGVCRALFEQDWNPRIYQDSSNHYQVIIISTNDNAYAISKRDNVRKKYPNAWILYIDNY